MATRITLTTNGKTTTHEIDMKGVAGGAFWATAVGSIVFAVGFATSSWHTSGSTHTGLWERCGCSSVESNSTNQAIQAFEVLGLIGMIISFILAGLYMFVHNFSKNIVLIMLVVFSFVTVVLILIGVVIFGTEYGDRYGTLNYSFAFAIIGAILVFIAGVLGLVQMNKSGLCKC